jgi:hypothetical protein
MFAYKKKTCLAAVISSACASGVGLDWSVVVVVLTTDVNGCWGSTEKVGDYIYRHTHTMMQSRLPWNRRVTGKKRARLAGCWLPVKDGPCG